MSCQQLSDAGHAILVKENLSMDRPARSFFHPIVRTPIRRIGLFRLFGGLPFDRTVEHAGDASAVNSTSSDDTTGLAGGANGRGSSR
jgi:hypothetical protein